MFKEKTIESGRYVAPGVRVYEVMPRGVLCESNIEGMTVKSNPWSWADDDDE